MSDSRRPLAVGDVAIIDDRALIGGYPAHAIVVLLDKLLPDGGIEAVVQASRSLSKQQQDEVIYAAEALRHAARQWQTKYRRLPEAFQSISDAPEAGLSPSTSMEIRPQEAALILGFTERRVRQLAFAGALPGQRDSRGHWLFARADVLALAKQRNAA